MLLAWSSEWREPWARRPLAATPPTPIATAPNATPRRMRTWFVKLGLIGLLLGLSLGELWESRHGSRVLRTLLIR